LLRKELYAYFHVDFQDYDTFYKIPFNKSLSEGDNSVDIMWILYHFTRGIEIERIKVCLILFIFPKKIKKNLNIKDRIKYFKIK
jgi:hypothetical protein